MTFSAPAADVPDPRRLTSHPSAFRRFVIDHNPFYLLSAACMLAGCVAIQTSVDPHPGQVHKLVALLATLNVYEFLLLAVALLLVHVGRRLRDPAFLFRDSRILLILQTVFLADAAFLAAETYTASLRVGTYAAAAAWLLAVVKVLLANKLLPTEGARSRTAVVLAALALLYALPGVLARADRHGQSVEFAIYALWWALGLLIAFAAVVLPTIPQSRMARAYLITPIASVLAHLLFAYWVYKGAEFHAANLVPLLLATAAMLARHARGRLPDLTLRTAIFLLVANATVCAVGAPDTLSFAAGQFTALRVNFIAAAAVFAWCFGLRLGVEFLAAAIVFATAASLGRSPGHIADTLRRIVNYLIDLLPTTATGWGLTAVAAAFVFLGAGAAISLTRPASRDLHPADTLDAT